MKKYFLYTGLGILATVQVQAQGLKIMPGARLTQTGGTTYIVLNDNAGIENNQTIQNTALAIKATGNGNSEVSGTSVLSIADLKLAKTTGNVLLKKDVQITNTVDFGGGLLDLNNYIVTLTGNAVLQNESETSRATGATGGSITASAILNAPLAANPGNLGVSITSSGAPGYTTVSRSHKVATGNAGASSILRSFLITPTVNAGLNAQMRFYYFDAESNTLDENQYDVYRSPNNGSFWEDIGATSRDATGNFVNVDNVDKMGTFTLSTVGNPLKVAAAAGTGNTYALMQNPVYGLLTVNVQSKTGMQLNAMVYDMTGRQILAKQVTVLQGSNNITADVAALTAGSYRLSITADGRQIWQTGFVKR